MCVDKHNVDVPNRELQKTECGETLPLVKCPRLLAAMNIAEAAPNPPESDTLAQLRRFGLQLQPPTPN